MRVNTIINGFVIKPIPENGSLRLVYKRHIWKTDYVAKEYCGLEDDLIFFESREDAEKWANNFKSFFKSTYKEITDLVVIPFKRLIITEIGE